MLIEGYASIYNVRDNGGDVVTPGAFGGDIPLVPLLWQHKPKVAIGRLVLARSDDRGLFIQARLVMVGQGAEAAALVQAGAVDGLSFGYRARKERITPHWRYLDDVELVEVSIVTFPMNTESRITAWRIYDHT